MTQRLPTPGGDDDTWGAVLNGFLGVSLASDGTINSGVVGQVQLDSPTQSTLSGALQKTNNLSDIPNLSTARSNLGLGDLATQNLAAIETINSNTQTGSYVLALSDLGGIVDCSASTAVTITVPLNASVAFPIGAVVEVCQYGGGQVTIAGSGGVTLLTAASLTTRAQYSTISLRQRATNQWIVGGDLS